MAQASQSLANGQIGVDTANVVVGPMKASFDKAELFTSSTGLVDTLAPILAIREPLGIAPVVSEDSNTVTHESCLTECPVVTDLAPAFTSAAAPKTPVTAVNTVPVLAVAPDLAPAFTSAAGLTTPVTDVDIVPVLEVAPVAIQCGSPVTPAPMVFTPKVQLQQLYTDSEFFRSSSSQYITSNDSEFFRPLHRPMPWPSFMGFRVAGDEARPLPWPSFRETNGCEFPGKIVEKVWWCSSDGSSAITCVVIELHILNSYGNLCTYTVGIIIQDMSISSELRWWNEVLQYLKYWWFPTGDSLAALSYRYLVVDIADGTGSLFIADSSVVGDPDFAVQSPIHSFSASESVSQLGTMDVHLIDFPCRAFVTTCSAFVQVQCIIIRSLEYLDYSAYCRGEKYFKRKRGGDEIQGASYCSGYIFNGVHMNLREKCLIQRLLLIGSVTSVSFLFRAIFVVLPKKQCGELMYVPRMYLANFHGLLGADECLDVKYPTHGVILQLSSAYAAGSSIISAVIVSREDDICTTYLTLNADCPSFVCMIMQRVWIGLNQYISLTYWKIVLTTTTDLQLFGPVLDSVVEHMPFLQHATGHTTPMITLVWQVPQTSLWCVLLLLQHVQTKEWLTSACDPGQEEGARPYSMSADVLTYIVTGNAEVQETIELVDIRTHEQLLKKEEFEGSGNATDNLTKSLLGLQGSAFYSPSDHSGESNRKQGCGEFSQASHSENLALIPSCKVELVGVVFRLSFLHGQGRAKYQCSTRVFALVQNEHKNSHMLLLPWVEHKDLSIGFQFQLSIILDDWRLIVRSVRLAVHVFGLPLAKRCQNQRSLHSDISLDGLLFLIQYVLNYMDYWWSTTAILTEIGSISSAGFSMQLCGTSFSMDHDGIAFLSSFLHENGLARYIFRPCALASMMKSLLEVCFTCVLPMCIAIKTESSRGSGGLFQCVPSYHLGKHFPCNKYLSDISSISRHYQFNKAVIQVSTTVISWGIQVSTTVISWVPGAMEGEVNQHWGISWDPRGCMFALHSCEKWWTTLESTPLHFSNKICWSLALEVEDVEFTKGCGQAHSQEGRHELIRVQLGLDNIAFLSQTPIGYDRYLDKAHSFTTFCSDLINYHDDTNTIREVHRPWDPGKSAFRHLMKTSAWGQAGFQEGRNVMGLANILHVGLVSWASIDGLDPSKLAGATYTQKEAPNTPSGWITNVPQLPSSSSVFLSSPTSGFFLL